VEQWIAALISFATAPLRDIIDAISERISWVYSLIVRVLSSVKNAHARLFDAVANFRNWIEWAIGEGFLTARWIITIRIPKMIGNLLATVTKWTANELIKLNNAVRALISALDRWARLAVAALIKDVSSLKKWIVDQINAILNTLVRVRDIVYMLLIQPKRLATWLVGAMAEELWSYANKNADRIALWMRAKSVKYTLQAAGQIESIIARLL